MFIKNCIYDIILMSKWRNFKIPWEFGYKVYGFWKFERSYFIGFEAGYKLRESKVIEEGGVGAVPSSSSVWARVLYLGQDRVKDVFPPQRRGEGLILGLQLNDPDKISVNFVYKKK